MRCDTTSRACYSVSAAYTPGAAVAKLAYAAGLKSAGDFPVVGSSPTSRTILFAFSFLESRHRADTPSLLQYNFDALSAGGASNA
jgi:hypothetical protein